MWAVLMGFLTHSKYLKLVFICSAHTHTNTAKHHMKCFVPFRIQSRRRWKWKGRRNGRKLPAFRHWRCSSSCSNALARFYYICTRSNILQHRLDIHFQFSKFMFIFISQTLSFLLLFFRLFFLIKRGKC